MTRTTSPLLTADRLSVARGDGLLLEDLSFSLLPGDALHVVGENGAGKSTLLLALAGLIPIASGSVHSPQEGVAFLGHDNGLILDLSVSENIDLYAGCGISPDPVVSNALGVDSLMNKPARTLSFGQARRVALALTCLPDKAVWMLDEPFAGLDQKTAMVLQSVLRDRVSQGIALIFSSHERSLEGARTLELVAQHLPTGGSAGGGACLARA